MNHGFSSTNQPKRRGKSGRGAMAVATARRRIRDAQTIGWKALEDSWQATLNQLLKAQA